jgi:hypothetical protein
VPKLTVFITIFTRRLPIILHGDRKLGGQRKRFQTVVPLHGCPVSSISLAKFHQCREQSTATAATGAAAAAAALFGAAAATTDRRTMHIRLSVGLDSPPLGR